MAALGLAGSLVSAMGAMSSANGAAAQADYNATVAKINARSERQKGVAEQERIDQKYDVRQGQATANAAASGIDPGYGSAALTIFGEGGKFRSMDESNAYTNAESAAVSQDNKARELQAQAAAQRQAGSYAGAGSFLSGLGGVARQVGGGNNPLLING